MQEVHTASLSIPAQPGETIAQQSVGWWVKRMILAPPVMVAKRKGIRFDEANQQDYKEHFSGGAPLGKCAQGRAGRKRAQLEAT